MEDKHYNCGKEQVYVKKEYIEAKPLTNKEIFDMIERVWSESKWVKS